MLPVVLRLRGGGYPKYIVDDAALLNDDHETVKNRVSRSLEHDFTLLVPSN
jgi:hypothetical protein